MIDFHPHPSGDEIDTAVALYTALLDQGYSAVDIEVRSDACGEYTVEVDQ